VSHYSCSDVPAQCLCLEDDGYGTANEESTLLSLDGHRGSRMMGSDFSLRHFEVCVVNVSSKRCKKRDGILSKNSLPHFSKLPILLTPSTARLYPLNSGIFFHPSLQRVSNCFSITNRCSGTRRDMCPKLPGPNTGSFFLAHSILPCTLQMQQSIGEKCNVSANVDQGLLGYSSAR
jgi:hypothetical protein